MGQIHCQLLFLLLITFFHRFTAAPIPENAIASMLQLPTIFFSGYNAIWISIGFLIICGLVLFNCTCCPNKDGNAVREGANETLRQLNNTSQLQNRSEFAIFPPCSSIITLQPVCPNEEKIVFEPLPDILPKNHFNGQNLAQSSKPAHFSALLKNKTSLHDWFDDPSSNFPRNQLQYFQELGHGWFGRVVEGEAHCIVDLNGKTPVVVKILREEASPSEHLYFLHEARPYRDLKHKNILKLLGQCLESDPFLLILEHTALNLKTFLLQYKENLNLSKNFEPQNDKCLRFAADVTHGLAHMHQHGFTHMDLAAHNCSVGSDMVVKLGDYGLAFDSFKEDYFCAGDLALPIRWYAPEVLHCTEDDIETREITAESNVWSLGVLFWEIFECGKLPYSDLTNEEVLQNVIIKRTVVLEVPRVQHPKKDDMYKLMQMCWRPVTTRPRTLDVKLMVSQLLDSSPASKTTFDQRWDSLHTNEIPSVHNSPMKFENDFVPHLHPQVFSSDFNLNESLPYSGSFRSPSLRGLTGSFDELATTHTPLCDSESASIQDSQASTNEIVTPEQISEAIRDLDAMLASEASILGFDSQCATLERGDHYSRREPREDESKETLRNTSESTSRASDPLGSESELRMCLRSTESVDGSHGRPESYCDHIECNISQTEEWLKKDNTKIVSEIIDGVSDSSDRQLARHDNVSEFKDNRCELSGNAKEVSKETPEKQTFPVPDIFVTEDTFTELSLESNVSESLIFKPKRNYVFVLKEESEEKLEEDSYRNESLDRESCQNESGKSLGHESSQNKSGQFLDHESPENNTWGRTSTPRKGSSNVFDLSDSINLEDNVLEYSDTCESEHSETPNRSENDSVFKSAIEAEDPTNSSTNTKKESFFETAKEFSGLLNNDTSIRDDNSLLLMNGSHPLQNGIGNSNEHEFLPPSRLKRSQKIGNFNYVCNSENVQKNFEQKARCTNSYEVRAEDSEDFRWPQLTNNGTTNPFLNGSDSFNTNSGGSEYSSGPFLFDGNVISYGNGGYANPAFGSEEVSFSGEHAPHFHYNNQEDHLKNCLGNSRLQFVEDITDCDYRDESQESEEVLKINTETNEAILVDSSESLIGFVPSRSIELLQELDCRSADMTRNSNNLLTALDNDNIKAKASSLPASPTVLINSMYENSNLRKPLQAQMSPENDSKAETELVDSLVGSPDSSQKTETFSDSELLVTEESGSPPDLSNRVLQDSGNHRPDHLDNSHRVDEINDNNLEDEGFQQQLTVWDPLDSPDLDDHGNIVLVLESEELLAGSSPNDDLKIPIFGSSDFLDRIAVPLSANNSAASTPAREVYTPDFESLESDDTSSSCSSTSGSFECIHNKFKDVVDISSAVPKSEDDVESEKDLSPLKVFSNTWDAQATPTKGLLKTPEKKVLNVKKSVSFHEDPQLVFQYPAASDSSEEEYTERDKDFTWHVDYTSYADWDLQANDEDEIPEEMIEIEELESEPYNRSLGFPRPLRSQPLTGSSLYTFTQFSEDEYDTPEMTGLSQFSAYPESSEENSPENIVGKPDYGKSGKEGSSSVVMEDVCCDVVEEDVVLEEAPEDPPYCEVVVSETVEIQHLIDDSTISVIISENTSPPISMSSLNAEERRHSVTIEEIVENSDSDEFRNVGESRVQGKLTQSVDEHVGSDVFANDTMPFTCSEVSSLTTESLECHKGQYDVIKDSGSMSEEKIGILCEVNASKMSRMNQGYEENYVNYTTESSKVCSMEKIMEESKDYEVGLNDKETGELVGVVELSEIMQASGSVTADKDRVTECQVTEASGSVTADKDRVTECQVTEASGSVTAGERTVIQGNESVTPDERKIRKASGCMQSLESVTCEDPRVTESKVTQASESVTSDKNRVPQYSTSAMADESKVTQVPGSVTADGSKSVTQSSRFAESLGSVIAHDGNLEQVSVRDQSSESVTADHGVTEASGSIIVDDFRVTVASGSADDCRLTETRVTEASGSVAADERSVNQASGESLSQKYPGNLRVPSIVITDADEPTIDEVLARFLDDHPSIFELDDEDYEEDFTVSSKYSDVPFEESFGFSCVHCSDPALDRSECFSEGQVQEEKENVIFEKSNSLPNLSL